jgi:deazaflavin-dependent oxidoreductase (nitroreductase family)
MYVMTQQRRDPAERKASLRLFYKGWRPTLLGRLVNRFWTVWAGLGLPPSIMLMLQVPGRKSGRLRSNVLVVVRRDGQRYLVSMLGERSEWVRNARAAKGRAFTKQGRSRPVIITEVPPQERAPIIKAYCKVATSGRHHFPVAYDAPVEEFAKVADDYPVFRVDPA